MSAPTRVVRNTPQPSPKARALRPATSSACTPTHSLGNKQEEMELRAQSESYVVIATTEMWCENSLDWKTTMWTTNSFRKIGREEEEVEFYFMEKRKLSKSCLE